MLPHTSSQQQTAKVAQNLSMASMDLSKKIHGEKKKKKSKLLVSRMKELNSDY